MNELPVVVTMTPNDTADRMDADDRIDHFPGRPVRYLSPLLEKLISQLGTLLPQTQFEANPVKSGVIGVGMFEVDDPQMLTIPNPVARLKVIVTWNPLMIFEETAIADPAPGNFDL